MSVPADLMPPTACAFPDLPEGDGGCLEKPLTSEPAMAEAVPLTSEPPLPAEPTLTSEPVAAVTSGPGLGATEI